MFICCWTTTAAADAAAVAALSYSLSDPAASQLGLARLLVAQRLHGPLAYRQLCENAGISFSMIRFDGLEETS